MSTGLTYLWVCDDSSSTNPTGTASFIFNDYSEAYSYGEWLGTFGGIQSGYLVFIWTAGPNQNGYWSSNPWIFTAID